MVHIVLGKGKKKSVGRWEEKWLLRHLRCLLEVGICFLVVLFVWFFLFFFFFYFLPVSEAGRDAAWLCVGGFVC